MTAPVTEVVMTPLAGKDSNLTASTAPTIGHINVYDTTPSGGNLTPPLPPLTSTAVGARMIVERYQGDVTGHTVTFTCAGGDTFDNGTTTRTLQLPGQSEELQVISVAGVKKWKGVGDRKTLGGLDTRYLGAVKAGVKGGKTTVLRRRDIAQGDRDRLSPWYGQITATLTAGFSSTIPNAQTYAMSASPSWCSPVNGAQFVPYPNSPTAYMMNWRSANGGIVGATTYPWPTATGEEFELDTTIGQAFEVYFRVSAASNFFYDLWIDGQRVWDFPQTMSITANTSQLLKFGGLPTGVHRYRVVINSGAIHSLFTPQYTIPVKTPARGPRIMTVTDSLGSVGANPGTTGMHTGFELGAWPWRLAEMMNCDDLWQEGIGSTGFIATAGGRTVKDGAITAGSNVLSSASAAFVSGDAGAAPANIVQVIGAGAGGGVLSALITSVTDGTHVVLDTAASTTVANAWTRVGGSAANFPIRAMTDVVPAAPDIVFVGGYHNDVGFGATAIADAYDRVLTTIQTALPNTMIIPFGAWDAGGTAGATYTTIDAAVLAVCTAHGAPYIETANNGNVYDGLGNLVATLGKWIDANTKNLYTCSDGTHETDAGMKYIAHRFFQALMALLAA